MELHRRETGENFDLVDGMVFGRLASCEATVDDSSISRRHAEVKQSGRAFELVDLGSSNGIFQNGQRKDRFLIRPGDLVTLGAVAFDVVGEAAAPGTPSAKVDLEVKAASPSPSASASAAPVSPSPTADAKPASTVSETDRARARLRREMTGDGRSSGFGDLSQQPLGIQLLIFAACVGVMYGVVVGIRFLAGSL